MVFHPKDSINRSSLIGRAITIVLIKITRERIRTPNVGAVRPKLVRSPLRSSNSLPQRPPAHFVIQR